MPQTYNPLVATRLTAIIQALQDVRDQPKRLLWNSRIPDIPATDEEILARYVFRVEIADLVADDEAAAVYSAGKFQFESNNIPNLKVGMHATQAYLNQLQAINGNGGIPNDPDGILSNNTNFMMEAVRLGVEQRKEALKIAMLMDGFSYDRLGIKMNNVSWGMPSDLKVTTGKTWDDPTSTPALDILTLKRTALVRYGQVFDRMTLSTAAWIYLTGNADFQNRARIFLPPSVSTAALWLPGDEQYMNVAKSVLGLKEIETYDSRYWSTSGAGIKTSAPYQSITNVILTEVANDGRADVWNFGNCPTTESTVSSLLPTNMIGGFDRPMRGPIAYATAPPDLNPPNLTVWGVARGWPRKNELQSSAVLTVGTFTDPIPVTEPF